MPTEVQNLVHSMDNDLPLDNSAHVHCGPDLHKVKDAMSLQLILSQLCYIVHSHQLSIVDKLQPSVVKPTPNLLDSLNPY